MLRILHLNDTETSLHTWARLSTLVRGRGRDLLLHAGDIRLGSPDDWGVVHAMNHMGFDMITLGNHDLDHGLTELNRQLAALRAGVVCANLTGHGAVAPFRLIERGGLRVAVTGVTLENMTLYQPERNMPGIAVGPPIPALEAVCRKVGDQVDLVVVISHCGLEADLRLARAVPGIDLIVGGHSHDSLSTPLQVGDTWIVQAGSGGACVGWVELTRSGARWVADGGLLPADGATPDPAVLALIPAPPPDADEVVAVTETDLRSADYACETPLGNLTADILRAYAGTDLALVRCSSVNNDFPVGPLRRADLGRLSYIGGDRVARVEVTGQELLDLLECGTRDAYYLLTAAGARVVYDGSRPYGERVRRLHVAGEPVKADGRYSIACTEILARGAAGFTPLLGKAYTLLDRTVQELLSEHIQSARQIRPAVDGRLEITAPIPRARPL